MPVTPTYPGVYVEEVPSGVRTIVGVSTATALFIGRAAQGPMNEPVLCNTYADFDKVFTSLDAGSELVDAVRLFFLNGGTKCYVVRVAQGATQSFVTLKSEAATDVLLATATSAGLRGDLIRLGVSYSGLLPESTFNLEVFRVAKKPLGEIVKEEREVWSALSMNPNGPRYAPRYVTDNSRLISLASVVASTVSPDAGYSQAGRPLPQDETDFKSRWIRFLRTDRVSRFLISVNGGAFVEVDLSGIDVEGMTVGSTTANYIIDKFPLAVENAIDPLLPGGAQVKVTLEPGPEGPGGDDTYWLRIASTRLGGDVLVMPATANDLAGPLMLGTAQGGLEVSGYAKFRPAPTGLVFKRDNLDEFGGLEQDAFTRITVGGTDIDLTNEFSLETSTVADARMYVDGFSTATGNSDGIREKWNLIRRAVEDKRADEPEFQWTAEVWGSRLALLPTGGQENLLGTVSTSGGDDENIGFGSGGLNYFIQNTRFYSLGPYGQGTFQSPSSGPANDGAAPALGDYSAALAVVDTEVDLFNLMVLPRDQEHSDGTRKSVWGRASAFCRERRAFLLMDPPDDWRDADDPIDLQRGVASLRIGLEKAYSAVFYPRLVVRNNGGVKTLGPTGAIAGMMARIDTESGVWKAPAGLDAAILGIDGIDLRLTDRENGNLNPRAVNVIRQFPAGIVNWGARTMDGDDELGSEYKYIPVRRLALFIEESLYRGTKFAVFQPNAEPLWAQLRLNVGAFMNNLFRKGAFKGTNPRDAYFVKCDGETTPKNDQDLGIVNVVVGFAPLKPAEFVIIRIQQMAGQVQT